jgi:hypothetical protein
MDSKKSLPLHYSATFSYGLAPNARSPLSEQQKQTQAMTVAKALEPKRVVGHGKVRVGRNHDGGYIHVDDFAKVDAALSFGIADDASWDLDMAQRNIRIQQFDYSIDKSPVDHPLITFHKICIAEKDGPGALSLDTIAGQYLVDTQRAILKIDIEGHEWPVFLATKLETLEKFAQIVCEFHGFNLLHDENAYRYMIAALRKLREVFEVVHVHGNNALPFAVIGNVVLPCLLEVTFANRRYYEFEETNEVFPTPLDQPNLPNRPDMRLGCFKF